MHGYPLPHQGNPQLNEEVMTDEPASAQVGVNNYAYRVIFINVTLYLYSAWSLMSSAVSEYLSLNSSCT